MREFFGFAAANMFRNRFSTLPEEKLTRVRDGSAAEGGHYVGVNYTVRTVSEMGPLPPLFVLVGRGGSAGFHVAEVR